MVFILKMMFNTLGWLRVKYPKEIKFSCVGCASCCRRSALLLPEDIERLSRVTGLNPEKFAVPVQGLEPYTHKLKRSGKACIFLKGNKCFVYPYRPLSCRFYPFILFQIGNEYVFIVDEKCRGLGRGSKLGREFFEKLLLEYLKWGSK